MTRNSAPVKRTTAASQPTPRGHQPLAMMSQAAEANPTSNIEAAKRAYDFLILNRPFRFAIRCPAPQAFSSPAYFSISFFWP